MANVTKVVQNCQDLSKFVFLNGAFFSSNAHGLMDDAR
jgi:hypothetical protein